MTDFINEIIRVVMKELMLLWHFVDEKIQMWENKMSECQYERNFLSNVKLCFKWKCQAI